MNAIEVTRIQCEIWAGTTVDDAIAVAITMAKEQDCVVAFSFNGIPIEVSALSEVGDVLRGWDEIKYQQYKLSGAAVQPDGTVKWGTDGR